MHRAIAAALQFPNYYGHNLDALNDCLGDVACYGPYDDAAEGHRSRVVLHQLRPVRSHVSQSSSDCAPKQRRPSPPRGGSPAPRFFALVHSNDPEIRFDPVGAMPVMWNSDDWLDCKRR